VRKKNGKYLFCNYCGKEFYVTKKRIEDAKYCSCECYWKSLKGRKLSEQHKKKISLSSKPNSGQFQKGYKSWNVGIKSWVKPWLGKHRSEETKGKLRSFMKGRHHSSETEFKKGQFSKEKHPNWKGGITLLWNRIRGLVEYQQWVKEVFKQDNYICQICYKRGGKLNVHHNTKSFSVILQEFLKEYNQFSPIEDRETLVRLAMKYQPFWDINNGITYCVECHKKFHKAQRKEAQNV